MYRRITSDKVLELDSGIRLSIATHQARVDELELGGEPYPHEHTELVQWITMAQALDIEPPEDLAVYKAQRFEEIDERTRQLIGDGFVYLSKTFSLSAEAQRKLHEDHQARDDPGFTYPVRYNTKDDSDAIDIPDATVLHALLMAACGARRACTDSGTALKDQIRAATTVAEVSAVEDER